MADLTPEQKEELEYYRYLELQEKEKAGTLGKGTTSAPKPELTESQKRQEEAAAFGRGGAYGISLGTAPAVEEAVSGVGKLFRGELPAVPGTPEFKAKVLERAKPYAEAKKQYPGFYGVGEFAGTAAASLPLSAGAAALGTKAASLVPETAPLARGLVKAGTEAAGEAAIGAGISTAQGQEATEGALIGAAGSLGGQLVRKGSEALSKAGQIPEKMKQAGIESAPEALRHAATEMAESPEKFRQYQMADYEVRKPGGLKEQAGSVEEMLKNKQDLEEGKFKQLQQDIETANKQKTADYQAALSEEDKAQRDLLNQTIDAVKRSRTEDAANKLSQTIDRGLKIQEQKAASKYNITFGQMLDPVDPAKSNVAKLNVGFNQLDQRTRGYAPDTMETLDRLSRKLNESAATGAHTTGKELEYLIEADKSLSADIRRLIANQRRDYSANAQDALANLTAIKQDINKAIQNGELGIPKEAVNQYNQAKAHYAEFIGLRDKLLDAQALVEKKVRGRTVIKPTAERAARILEPKVEDYTKTADVMQAVGQLPSNVEGVPAITPEQFLQLKQQATTMPAGLLPERTRPVMPAPELQPVPTQRVITPEEAGLQGRLQELTGQMDVQRGRAAAFEELARPGDVSRSDFVPGKIGMVQKVMGATPAAKISRAQTVERMFKNPGLSFAVRVLEGQKKVFTLPMVQMLARQYQVDPTELQKALAEQPAP